MAKPRIFEPNYQSSLGLKQGHAITGMPFGSLLDVQNMNLDGVGGKSTRRGYQPVFSVPTNEEVRGLFDYKKTDGTQLVLAYAHDVIYEWNGATVTSLITGLTIDTNWQFAQYQDRALGVNGVDNSFTYDGSSFTKISLTAPASHVAVAATADATSTLDGHYKYVVTFYDSARGAESNPPDLATAPEVDVGAINTNAARLGPFPTVAAGETATDYRVYRMWVENNAAVAQETIFTRVAELDYATYVGTTYDDAGLASGTLEVERDTGQQDAGNTPHPTSKIIVEAFDRIFMVDESDPTNLVYSRAGRP